MAGNSEGGVVKALTDSPQNQHSGARSESSKTDLETRKGTEPLKPKHERQLSQEEGDLRRRSTDSPLRNENAGRKTPFESSPLHLNAAGDTPKRGSRQSDRSLEVSPLHPHSHSRLGGKGGSGVSSPSWERKGSSEGSRGGIAPSTPARSRLRPVAKVDDTPDNSPVVPKFGDWDDNDPSSAEQFTQVFDRVRDDKLSGAGKVPAFPNDTSYSNSDRQYRNDNAKGCSCFPWLRK